MEGRKEGRNLKENKRKHLKLGFRLKYLKLGGDKKL